MKIQRCKLTDQNMQTRHGCQWVLNKWQETSGGGELCSDGWLHYYSHPLLAVLLNGIHAKIKNPRLFEVETAGKIKHDNGLKSGATKMRLVRELVLPAVSSTQRIAFGILIALKINTDENFAVWANDWLTGRNRSPAAAFAAYAAANSEYMAIATGTDAASAADAAYAAANSAYMVNAANAACAAYAANAAYSVLYAATSRVFAEISVAYVVRAASTIHPQNNAKKINFMVLAKMAMKYE